MSREKHPADPFADVRAATVEHRARHGCGAHPYANGPLLGALAAAANARRILELGTSLGYTALWLAHGAPDAVVDTIERDAEHVRLAREHIEARGLIGHIVVHQGDFAPTLRRLAPGYDIAFFDGFTPTPTILAELRRLLRQRGLLISANLTHGGEAVAYRDALLDADAWLTAFVDDDRETAVSIIL
jgi:predicted O-methyltransferase YrrM